MSIDGSVSVWIAGVKAGCESAANHLWTRYQHRVVGVARRKLFGELRSVYDEEDVAVTTFHSFLRRCRNGSYPDLHDREELWRLLVTITAHKVSNQVRDQNCPRRGVNGAAADPLSLEDVTDCEHLATCVSPEMVAMVADSLNHLLLKASDGELRSIVLYKLEGYSNDEVAAKIGRSVPTIERRLRLVRDMWLKEMQR